MIENKMWREKAGSQSRKGPASCFVRTSIFLVYEIVLRSLIS